MSVFMWIACAAAASLMLTIRKAIDVARGLGDGGYRITEFTRIFVVWVGMTAMSVASVCGPLGCSYGLRFGWAGPLLEPLGLAPAIGYVLAAMIAYILLSGYLAGHVLGWLAFGVGRLMRREAA